MTKFILELDLSNHEHHHAARQAVVREMLGLAIQAVGSNPKRKGELTMPIWDASQSVNRHVTIGSWEFNETRNPVASEAAPREAA
jgi:hypothetical protein